MYRRLADAMPDRRDPAGDVEMVMARSLAIACE
jgi:hypothetical protein